MKEKRKGQPDNLKRYWLIFGLLAIVLLFPIRLWEPTFPSHLGFDYTPYNSAIYIAVTAGIVTSLIHFFRINKIRMNWKIVLLMMICLLLSGNHALERNAKDTEFCILFEHDPITGAESFDWLIFESVWCARYGGPGVRQFVGINYTAVAIDVSWVKSIFLPRNQVYFNW